MDLLILIALLLTGLGLFLSSVLDIVYFLVAFLVNCAIPIVVVQLIFALAALIHILKRPRCQVGSQPMWIVLILIFQMTGSLAYFIIGRGKNTSYDIENHI